MNRFSNFLAPIRDSVDDRSLVEPLLQRIAESALLEDRRHALQALRDSLGDARALTSFGACDGFQVLMVAAREDRDDIESVRAALEAMGQAVEDPTNATQLSRTPNALAYLLSILEPPPVGSSDFYIRYHSLHVLQTLSASNTNTIHALKDAVLSAPLGIVRLLDLMTTDQEALRNEALLLLRCLAASAPEVQKIAAFEGALEKAFVIAKEEQGGVVVQDSLLLIADILRNNGQNQLMFRENGLIPQVLALLERPQNSQDPLDPDSIAGIVASLDVILVLLTPCSGDEKCHVQNMSALLGLGLMGILIRLGLEEGGHASPAVRCRAIRCLSAVVGNTGGQREGVAFLTVKDAAGDSLQLPHAALRAALGAASSEEASVADGLLEACCRGNPGLQAALASTFSAGQGHTFGGELLTALAQRGSLPALTTASRAALALSHLVSDNDSIKTQLLAQRMAAPMDNIMNACASALATTVITQGGLAAAARPAIDYFRCLIDWTYNCPAATSKFLSSVSKTPFLVGAIKAGVFEGDTVAKGVAALFLGLCAMQADAPQSKVLVEIAIIQQLTLDGYLNALEGLFQAANGVGGLDKNAVMRLAELAAWVRREVVQKINSVPSEGVGTQPPTSVHHTSSPPAVPLLPTTDCRPGPLQVTSTTADTNAQALIALLHKELEHLRSRNAALAEDVVRLSSVNSVNMPTVRGMTSLDKEKLMAAEREAATLRDELMSSVQRESEAAEQLKRAEMDAQAAQETASRIESELQDLSAAYATLDAHAHALQSRVDELEDQEGLHEKVQASSDGILTQGEVQALIDKAVDEVRQEAEMGMEDLLVCLGEEEAKVSILREALEGKGINCDELC